MPSETSQTLDRGLRALRVLAETPEGLTITELSGRLQVNRTVVYRLVSTLEQHALVRRDAHGRLHVGLGVLHLATAVQPVLRDVAIPVLRQLAEATAPGGRIVLLHHLRNFDDAAQKPALAQEKAAAFFARTMRPVFTEHHGRYQALAFERPCGGIGSAR